MKRIPGILAFLIVTTTLTIPIAREFIHVPHLPSSPLYTPPFAVGVPSAVWLISIVMSTLCFIVASIFPKTSTTAWGWIILGLVLLGSGGYYKLVAQKASLSHLNDTNWDKDPDVPRLRADLEKLIPLQTSLANAKARMERKGFACATIDETQSRKTVAAKPMLKLYCQKVDRWPKYKYVVRRWEVDFRYVPHRNAGHGLRAMYVRCSHYLWRIFLFSAFAYTGHA